MNQGFYCQRLQVCVLLLLPVPTPSPSVFPWCPPLSYCSPEVVPRCPSHSFHPSQGRGLSFGPSLPSGSPLPPLWSVLHYRPLACPGHARMFSSSFGNDSYKLHIAFQSLDRGVHWVPLPEAFTELHPSSQAHPLDQKRVRKAGLGTPGSLKEK